MNFKENKTIFYVVCPSYVHDIVIGREVILKKMISEGYKVIIIFFDKKDQIIFGDFANNCEVFMFKELNFLNSILQVIYLILAEKNYSRFYLFEAELFKKLNIRSNISLKMKILKFILSHFLSEDKLHFLFKKVVLLTRMQRLYKKMSPSLSIFYEYTSSIFEVVVMLAAANVGSRTISIIDRGGAFSGIFPYFKTDFILVWDEVMKREAVERWGIKDSFIKPVGILKVDSYKISNKKLQSKDEFIRSNGLLEGRKIISVIGGNISLLEASRIGILFSSFKEIQILYRSRPSRQESFEEDKEFLKCLQDKYLFLIKGFSIEFKESQTQDQLFNTANFLKNSDIVISRASAMGVEAMYFNVPSIFLLYGRKEELFWYQQRRFVMLLEKGLIRTAKDDLELINTIKYYLENPRLDIHMRARLFGSNCCLDDGDSIQRCHKEIKYCLENL